MEENIMKHTLTINAEVTCAVSKTVEVTDEQYEALKTDSPESVLGEKLFEELEDEARDPDGYATCDYQISDENGRILFDWD